MSKPVILVVEDDKALNEAYQMILNGAGYEVKSARNGQEALDIVTKMKDDPDMILLDLRMPVLDGVGFLKSYKPKEHPGVKILVFSNYDMHEDIDKAYDLGAERYVLKARATPKDLLHLVKSMIVESRTAARVS